MTDLEKAARMALEALEDYKRSDDDRVSIAMYALRQALAESEQQAQQEPVAWMHTNAIGHVYFRKNPQDKTFNPVPLYTHPHGVTGESK